MKLNNYYVGQKLREISKTSGVDTPVIEECLPVIVINPIDAPAEVSPSFMRPNSKQRFKTLLLNKGAAGDFQVATATSSLNIYFVGAYVAVSLTAGGNVNIADATSGTLNAPDGATNYMWSTYGAAATNSNYGTFIPMPIKCTSGIRISGIGHTAWTAIVYYIEEDI